MSSSHELKRGHAFAPLVQAQPAPPPKQALPEQPPPAAAEEALPPAGGPGGIFDALAEELSRPRPGRFLFGVCVLLVAVGWGFTTTGAVYASMSEDPVQYAWYDYLPAAFMTLALFFTVNYRSELLDRPAGERDPLDDEVDEQRTETSRLIALTGAILVCSIGGIVAFISFSAHWFVPPKSAPQPASLLPGYMLILTAMALVAALYVRFASIAAYAREVLRARRLREKRENEIGFV